MVVNVDEGECEFLKMVGGGGCLRSQEGRNAKKGRQRYNRDVWEEVMGKMA